MDCGRSEWATLPPTPTPSTSPPASTTRLTASSAKSPTLRAETTRTEAAAVASVLARVGQSHHRLNAHVAISKTRHPLVEPGGRQDRLDLIDRRAIELSRRQVVATDRPAERLPEVGLERRHREVAISNRVDVVAGQFARERPAGKIGDLQSGDGRDTVALRHQRQCAAPREVVEVVTGAPRHRAARAVARNGAIDERRIDGRQRGIAELHPVEDPGPKALHQDVRIHDPPAQRLAPGLRPQVEGQNLLTAMQGVEVCIAAGQPSNGVTGRWLELGYVRTLRLEQLGAVRTREQTGKIDDTDAGKRHAC